MQFHIPAGEHEDGRYAVGPCTGPSPARAPTASTARMTSSRRCIAKPLPDWSPSDPGETPAASERGTIHCFAPDLQAGGIKDHELTGTAALPVEVCLVDDQELTRVRVPGRVIEGELQL